MKCILWIGYLLGVSALLLKALKLKTCRGNKLLCIWLGMSSLYQLSCAVFAVACMLLVGGKDCETIIAKQIVHWFAVMMVFCVAWFALERLGDPFRVGRRKVFVLILLTGVWLACEADCLAVTIKAVGGWHELTMAMKPKREERLPSAFVSAFVSADANREYARCRLGPSLPLEGGDNPEMLVDKDYVHLDDVVFHSRRAMYSLQTKAPVAVELSGDMTCVDQEDMDRKIRVLLQRLGGLLDCSFGRVQKVDLPVSYLGDGNDDVCSIVHVHKNPSGKYNVHVRLHVELRSLADSDKRVQL